MREKVFQQKDSEVCRHCSFVTHPFVPGSGNLKAKLVVIARDPGTEEEDQSEPLVGEAGQMFETAFNEAGKGAGVTREDVFCTYAVKCKPPDSIAGTADWKQAAKQCAYYLKKELEQIKPRVILAMGNEALAAAHGKQVMGGITQHRGQVSELPNGAKLVPAFHPAYILRSPAVLPIYLRDLEKAIVEMGSKKVVSKEDELGYEYRVIKTLAQFDKLLLRLKSAKKVSVDTETTGLCWHRDKIICTGVCIDDHLGYVIPFRTYHVKEIEGETKTGRKRKIKKAVIKMFWSKEAFAHIKEGLNEVFQDTSIQKTLQNAKFDLHFLWQEGIKLRGLAFDDTMVMQHMADENAPRDLKTMVSIRAPHMAGYERRIKAQEEYSLNLVAVTPEVLYQYNAGDIVGTRIIEPSLIADMKKELVYDYYKKRSIPILRFLFDIERRGVKIGRQELAQVKGEVERKLEKLLKKMQELAGPKFNPNRPVDVSNVLFKKLSLPVVAVSEKTGAASTNKATLEELLAQYDQPFCKQMLEYRSLKKLYGTYIVGMGSLLDKSGRLHTTFRQARTVTGRLSSSEPNLQNIPSKGPMRKMFVASPGWKLICGDLSQAEYRVAAVVSGDKNMLKAFASGRDFHDEVARIIAQIPAGKKVPKAKRSIGKAWNFGTLYGKREEDTAKTCGVPWDEARVYFERYWKEFAQLKQHMKRIPKLIDKQGFIRNVFGRKRRFNLQEASRTRGGLNHVYREGLNFEPQSCASEVNTWAALQAQKRYKKLRMRASVILLVHDSVMVEAPDNEVIVAARILHEEMSRPVPELKNHSFPAEMGIGQTWYEAEVDAKAEDKYGVFGQVETIIKRFRSRLKKGEAA